MQKQAIVPLIGLAARRAVGLAGKALPKALTMGYKRLARPIVRKAFKHPGMVLTGAIMPSWIGGYMNTAREKGLSSLPRSLPKFASIQGDGMSGKKYPSIFYKVAGFEKMAAESEAAHRLVLDWNRGLEKKSGLPMDIFKNITGFGQKSTISMIKEEMAKNLAKELPVRSVEEIPKLIADYKDRLAQTAKEIKPKNLKEMLRGGSRLMGALAIGVPAYYFGHKAYKDYQENKALEGSYNNMLKVYPELQRENPQNTRQYFDYIKQYSPTIAKNPHAAGAIIRRFASTGGIAIDSTMIKSLLEVEKVKSDAGDKHQGMLGALGAMI